MKTQLFKLNKRNLFFAVCNYFAIVLAILLIVVSCNKNDEITGGGSSGGGGGIGGNKGSSSIVGSEHKNFNLLIGTWQGQDPTQPQEAYIFDGTNFYSKPDPGYSIEVLEISWTTDTKGFFYGKYLSSWDENSVGKYYAVSFTNLSETDLSISGALNGTHGSAAVEGYAADTLEEAKTNFTIEKGSFAQYTQCKKN